MAGEVAKFIVVVSGYIQDVGTGPGESHDFRDDAHVRVTEPWLRFHSLDVDDVADQVDTVGFDFREKVEEFGRPGSAGPEMKVGNPQRTIAYRHSSPFSLATGGQLPSRVDALSYSSLIVW
jgi:hypothetical protein